jgi:hypothetical protein
MGSRKFPQVFFGLLFAVVPLFFAAAQEAPPSPELRLALTAEGLVVLEAPGTESRVAAVVDVRQVPRFIPDIRRMEPLPPSSYAAVVWAVDGAGNYSEPRPVLLDFPPLRIENPLPGTWANPQRLVISGVENKQVFWTIDGSDPAGPQGLAYRGPVLIDRTGTLTLRVAARHADGRLQEEALGYTVSVPREDLVLARAIGELRAEEEGSIRAPAALSIPLGCLWSPDGPPWHPGGREITLRPEGGIKRYAPLHIAGAGGHFRFIFTLDGTGGEPPPGEGLWDAPLGVYTLPASPPGTESPRLVYAGASRVLVWPRGGRYIWEGGTAWEEGDSPTPVPPEGGVLRWTVGGGEGRSGVFGLRIEPAAPQAEGEGGYSRGRFAYRSLSGTRNRAWNYSPDLLSFSGDIAAKTAIEVCDGEDLEWRFVTREGIVRGSWRSDRLPPPAPGLIAPAEGAWVRGPVSLSIAGTVGEPGLESTLLVRLRYSSGRTETLRGRDTVIIPALREDTAEVHLEAQFTDAAGNRGPLAVRNFGIDSAAVYVSARGQAGPESGSRDAPFRYLDDALDLARREGRNQIRVAGLTQLRRPQALSGDMSIDGGFDENWTPSEGKARITVPGEAVFRLGPGNLSLRNLSLEREAGGDGLFWVETGAALELEDVSLTLAGPFLRLDELGRALFSAVRVMSLIGGNSRIPLISGTEAQLELRDCLFELEGEDGVLFDLRGGRLRSEDSSFRLRAQRTGAALIFREVRGEMTDTEVFVEAGDYACALDLRRSELLFTRGSLGVSARDGVAVVSDNSQAMYLGAEFTVASSFVARAMEVRSRFPAVTDCRFSFTGSARQAEVFSGTPGEGASGGIPLPGAGTIGGNVFSGFTHILGTAYPLESLTGFNRAFAPPGRPNTSGESAVRR